MERLSDFVADIVNDLYENSDWYGDYSLIEAAINRLAAYEETGLGPEEIELLAKQRDLYVDACGELPLKRIRELAQTDREGRCVVLDIPTIDAVPVVRCRECSYRLPKGTVCQLSGVTITGDDFCSRGQRKEADHDKHPSDPL